MESLQQDSYLQPASALEDSCPPSLPQNISLVSDILRIRSYQAPDVVDQPLPL